jgi:Ca2+-transporting ATPase
MTREEVERALKTSDLGLTEEEAQKRLLETGFNELKERGKRSPFLMFLDQFKDFLILILLVAALIAAAFGELTDAAVIFVIVILNALLGFIQEHRAEKSMEALRNLVAPRARVVRGGNEADIFAKDLVPGDVIILRTGDKISADSRLIEVVNLEIDESSLTGESIPVKKTMHVVSEKAIAERKNMAYSATSVTFGRGKAVVVATGMATEVGRIAQMIQEAPSKKTPLQVRLENFGKWLGVICLVICAIVFLVYYMRGIPALEAFITSVSLAVAAIHEGLPAVVTVALALGMQAMAKRNSIVRKLRAVETLGGITFICSDKTGTLTKNEMTVRKIFTNDMIFDVTGEGYEPVGDLLIDQQKTSPPYDENFVMMGRIGALCNDARLLKKGSNWSVDGDPTEGALIVGAAKLGVSQEEVQKEFSRVGECPFSSERKLMTTIHMTPEGSKVAYVKGAPEIMINLCEFIYKHGRVKKITEADKDEIASSIKNMASRALRLLGFAYRELPLDLQEYSVENVEKDLVFVGMTGMIDAPRSEAKDALRVCEKAGIRVAMITGDNKHTAMAVADELGLLKENRVLTGSELDDLSDEEIERLVDEVSVYARVSPEHKLRIVKALKKRGHIVAMTGDGVNDAPALKNADIGVAMGITGTDVAKEASDMILADDNFATIVAAVKEGRAIYENIKKFIFYLISSNFGEILTVFLAALVGFPLPIIAIQILWINLVTDGGPALALGVDPPDPDIMSKPPRNTKESIFSTRTLTKSIATGSLMCVGTLALFVYEYGISSDMRARTIAFTTLVMFQIFNALNSRSEKFSLFQIGLFSNKYLLGALGLSVLLQVAVVYVPFLQTSFRTEALDIFDWVIVTLVASSVLIMSEIWKAIDRSRSNRSSMS